MKNHLLIVLLALISSYVQAQCGSATYTEPQFTIAVQNPACPLAGEIKVTSESGGIGPYSYTLLPNNITNSSGTFSNLVAGSYIVQMTDACGTIRSRQATITPYSFTTTSTMTPLGCKNFRFNIGCSAAGPVLQYGYALNGSSTIIWGDSSQIHLTLDAGNSVALYVRDSCGNQAVSTQQVTKEIMGYIKELQERLECDGVEIYPVYYGFNAPTVCLYKYPQRTLVACKQAPSGNYTGGDSTNFFDLPYGQEWYVIVQDGCYRDSMYFPDKTSKGGSELNPHNWKCNTFDMHADGNNRDSACLWNATTNQLISCKPNDTTTINPNTGKPWPYGGAVWTDLPYGSYYSYIYDPCEDTLVRIDTTVRYPLNFRTEMYYHCSVIESAVGSYFDGGTPRPHKTSIYYPNNTLAATYTDAGNYLLYPTWPLPGNITVVQEDGCGFKDTSTVYQPMLLPSRTVTVKGGCPGINGNSGGGDILLSGDGYAYGGRGNGAPVATITIIKKDSVTVNIPQNYTQWNSTTQQQDFYFTNLATGKYILQSTIGCYGFTIYDTVDVKEYVYPLQEQTHILQCGSNPYAFKDTITGGVAPYTYEIISSNPNMPSLLTGTQSSNVFSIPPGTDLNTITIRVLDACGNSHTKEFPVNHAATCYPLPVDSVAGNPQLQNKLVRIYPNPSGKQFTIAFMQKKKTDYQLNIYNAAGVNMYNRTLKNIDTKNLIVEENFRPGTYIVSIVDLKNNKQFYYKQVIL
jgi:hypothetical protein